MSMPIYMHGRREVRKMIAQSLLVGVLIATVVMYLLSPSGRRS